MTIWIPHVPGTVPYEYCMSIVQYGYSYSFCICILLPPGLRPWYSYEYELMGVSPRGKGPLLALLVAPPAGTSTALV